jgi:hypothetical protein
VTPNSVTSLFNSTFFALNWSTSPKILRNRNHKNEVKLLLHQHTQKITFNLDTRSGRKTKTADFLFCCRFRVCLLAEWQFGFLISAPSLMMIYAGESWLIRSEKKNKLQAGDVTQLNLGFYGLKTYSRVIRHIASARCCMRMLFQRDATLSPAQDLSSLHFSDVYRNWKYTSNCLSAFRLFPVRSNRGTCWIMS